MDIVKIVTLVRLKIVRVVINSITRGIKIGPEILATSCNMSRRMTNPTK